MSEYEALDGTVNRVLAFAVIAAIVFAVLDWFRIPTFEWTLAFVPELVAGLTGVLLGFVISRRSDVKSELDRAPQIRQILKGELERIEDAAPDSEYIPTDAWNALVSSGDSSLLDLDLQEKLFELYAFAKRLAVRIDLEHRGQFDGYKNRRMGERLNRMVVDLLKTPHFKKV